jgi:hypothetical protein
MVDIDREAMARALVRSESSIEGAFDKWARDQGWVTKKLNAGKFNSWPDRLVCMDNGRICFIEFKRPRKKATEKQDDLHKLLRGLGHEVLCTSSIIEAKNFCLRVYHKEKK